MQQQADSCVAVLREGATTACISKALLSARPATLWLASSSLCR